MWKIVIAAVVLSLVPWAYGEEPVAGSGSTVTESRELDAFHAIDFRIPGDLKVTIGEQTPVTVNTDDNIAPLIKTEIKDGKLTIWADQSFSTKNEPDVRITIPDLRALSVHGSGDAHVKGLDNEALAVAAKGSADIHLYGQTKSLALTLHGSADVHAFQLASQKAVVTVHGSADAKISVDESLVATVHGSGDLVYAGDPTVVKQVHGSGDVRKQKS